MPRDGTTLPAVVETVRLVAERRPFSGRADRVVLDLAAGLTLAEMVERAGIRPGLRPFAVAYIGDHRIDWAMMHRVRPKAGALVAVKIVPGFGGDTGRSIAMLAVFVAAAAAAAATGGLLLPLVGPVAASVGAGLVGAAVTLAGTLAINALMPVQQPRLENLSGATAAARTSPTLSITGSRNRLAPYAPVPRCFGRTRVHPPMAARPYTEIAGEDQYLRLLFDFGYGPLTLTDMRIGEVDLAEYDDVSTVAYEDYQAETLTLYPDTVGTEAFNIEVTNAGGPLTVVTAVSTAEMVIDITLFEGLFQDQLVTGGGGSLMFRTAETVQVKVEHRLNGTADGFVDAGTTTYTAYTKSLARFAIRVVLPSVNKWDLRVTRLTNDNTESSGNTERHTRTHLTALKSISYASPVNVTGHTLLEMRIRATDQVNGVVDTFSAEVQAKLPVWNGALTLHHDFAADGDLAGRTGPALTLTRADPGTYFDSAGVMRTAGIDVARFTYVYDGARWIALGLLIEPLAAKLLLRSDEFDNAVWFGPKDITANDTIAPDGTATADRSNATGYFQQARTVTPGATYTVAILARKDTDGTFSFRYQKADATERVAWIVDLDAETVAIQSVVNGTEVAKGIIDVGGGWFLVWGSGSLDTTTSAGLFIQNASGTWFWRGNLELGDFPTSLTKTEDAAVNRAADVNSTDVSALLGAANTPFIAARTGYGAGVLWQIDDGTENERYRIERNASDEIHVIVTAGGVLQADLNLGAVADQTDLKVAARLAANDFAASLDGAAVVTDSSGSLPVGVDTERLGMDSAGNQWGGTIAERKLWNLGKPNADLIALAAGTTDGFWDAPTATRNPAWAALEVLRGSANARGWADANLDLAQWKAFADRCDELDQNSEEKYRFDGVVDFSTTVFQVVRDILGTARADFAIRDGKASVVWDDPNATVVQAFTPKNSWGFKASRTYPRLPHALRVRFVNEEADWQEDEITVYDDGFDATSATRFETLELWGVARESQAWREGRYRLAEGRLRPETVEFQADIEHLVCQRGDLIAMTHDVMLWGLASGRIKSLTTDGGGNVTTVTLDETVTMEVDKAYGIVITKGSDTTSTTHGVDTEAGQRATLTLTTAIPAGSAPVVGEFVQFGPANAETVTMKVKAILPGPDLTARLVCVDPADAVHTSDTGTIPDFDPRITVPPVPGVRGPARPVVLDVKSDESVLIPVAGGGLEPRVLVTLQVPADTAALERGEAQYRPTGTDQSFEQLTFQPTATSVSFRPVNEGLAYDLRLRYRSSAGVESEWTNVTNHTVVGKSTLPPDVPSALIDANRVITWPYPDQPLDFDGFRVRTHQGLNTNWSTALPAHSGLLTVTQFDGATLPGGTLTVLVKGVDVAGNESAAAAVLILALGDPIVANVIESRDFRAAAFPGTITNGTVSGGDLKADAGGVFWSGVAAAQFWQADDTKTFWSTFYLQMTYVAQWAPPGSGQLTLALTVAAVGWSIEYRPAGAQVLFWSGTASTVFWTGDGEAFWSAQPAFQPWPGAIEATQQPYDFRLKTESGAIQGKVTEFTATVDVDDVDEVIEDLTISASGTRLPIVKSYQKIKAIAFNLQADGNGARSIEVADKDVSLGPLINAYNAAGAQVAATADFTVQGY